MIAAIEQCPKPLVAMPVRPAAPERSCWPSEQAAAFLHHNATAYADQLTDLFEPMIGTGPRHGEARCLHWHDVHLAERRFYLRWPLTSIGNENLYLGPPKTRASPPGSRCPRVSPQP